MLFYGLLRQKTKSRNLFYFFRLLLQDTRLSDEDCRYLPTNLSTYAEHVQVHPLYRSFRATAKEKSYFEDR
jgi:hypothetical protein